MPEVDMSDANGRRMRRRVGKTGPFLLALGGLTLGLCVLGVVEGRLEDRLAGIGAGVSIGLMILGLVGIWRGRSERAAGRSLPTSARDRAIRDRAWMASFIPFSMIVFGGLSVMAIGDLQAGTGDIGDGLMVGVGLLYGWLGPLIIMGWDGKSLKNRRLLEDELTRHHRARAVIPGFIALLSLMTGLVVIGLWRADLAVRLGPLAISVAGAAATLRFAHLERQADAGD